MNHPWRLPRHASKGSARGGPVLKGGIDEFPRSGVLAVGRQSYEDVEPLQFWRNRTRRRPPPGTARVPALVDFAARDPTWTETSDH
jgi:hypothetical protein